MTQVVPLHAQVAIALGCRTKTVEWSRYDQWVCTCDRLNHADPDALPDIKRYDIDWSAGGPLITGFGIELARGHVLPGGLWKARVTGMRRGRWSRGATPLEAVCYLILALHDAGKLVIPTSLLP